MKKILLTLLLLTSLQAENSLSQKNSEFKQLNKEQQKEIQNLERELEYQKEMGSMKDFDEKYNQANISLNEVRIEDIQNQHEMIRQRLQNNRENDMNELYDELLRSGEIDLELQKQIVAKRKNDDFKEYQKKQKQDFQNYLKKNSI